MTPKMQEYGEALFQCLPADTADDIRKRMNKELGVRWTTNGMVSQIISYVRKHYQEIGFTVPHVKRGKPDPDEQGRFFAVLVEKDGSFYFDDEHRGHLHNGTRSSIANLARQTTNLRAIVATCKQYERSKARRDYLDELEENFEFVAKRSARILKFMDNQAA
jgi:hypothetical protein